MTLSEMKGKIQTLQSSIIAIAGEAMLDNKEAITSLVVQQQYEQGIGGDGVPLKPYTPAYRRRKQKLGVLQDHTDYNLTGKMHTEMDLTVEGDIYDINSTTQVNGYTLSDLLKNRDTSKSFDLTEDNKKKAWEIILPDFMEKIGEVIVVD